jgi:hypothetical protein
MRLFRKQNSGTLEFSYKNSRDVPRTFILEPWAEEFIVPPGARLVVNIRFDRPSDFESEETADYFVLWLWSGCQAEVILDGTIVSSTALDLKIP